MHAQRDNLQANYHHHEACNDGMESLSPVLHILCVLQVYMTT